MLQWCLAINGLLYVGAVAARGIMRIGVVAVSGVLYVSEWELHICAVALSGILCVGTVAEGVLWGSEAVTCTIILGSLLFQQPADVSFPL